MLIQCVIQNLVLLYCAVLMFKQFGLIAEWSQCCPIDCINASRTSFARNTNQSPYRNEDRHPLRVESKVLIATKDFEDLQE